MPDGIALGWCRRVEDAHRRLRSTAFPGPVDEEAPYEDALVSVERLRRRDAMIAVRTLPGLDHVNSWIQALPRAVRWFRVVE
jgi:hypothetical protein